MIIVMEKNASEENIKGVQGKLQSWGFSIHLSQGVEKTIIGAVGEKSHEACNAIEALEGVEKVVTVLTPYKLASREFKKEDTVITIGDVKIGGKEIQVMAGPCAVESREQLLEVARLAKKGGARILRGGAFKPRTSPYSFQGLEEEGLKYLAEAREQTGLLIVSEVIDPRDVELVAKYVDILQVGARNMQNFALLRAVGKANKPVLLKRGISATIEEWIMAGEYILAEGNENVMFCERGIRTFETFTRNTLDLSAVPIIKQLTHLPIIVDPSHGTGKWKLVNAMSKGAIACGADGLIVEMHPEPSEALSDGPQSLKPEKYEELMKELQVVASAVGRSLELGEV
ncbi:3-deoxy-D-arabinoheptulosonate-7-phosphate synthase [Desulfonispora thiosulfatigenes DSM 11270]|uniref:3-deoxy-D-arabinoheptulosonate-7-phosphate synthase n=1 Tax=Desulfonispora thiosulfatigenes DSM 11270 TaxID=656914 RepID=A0A1W1V7B2_DESTI|nr:3-deoxy-7-phosphoheptulonate synthase [Desulfonispora thiosulfatigenes]SMB89185.1 3-deoxy-D-arabinoheptulosonate-7-phosphate synthase [Desulfonispora thiosulfatigenes DSM 11270]